MTASRISLISPTGALDMGFLDQSLERGISLKPDVIACDAGSTDSGWEHFCCKKSCSANYILFYIIIYLHIT